MAARAGGTELVLHADPDLPAEATYFWSMTFATCTTAAPSCN
jgi:hypothetical protein